MEVIAELCIVYDDISKVAANGLRNKLAKSHICIAKNEKDYQEKSSTSSRQKILYLSEKLIKDNLPKDMWDESISITENTSLVHIGNQYGIVLEECECDKVPFFTVKDWWKYLLSLVALGIISFTVAIVLWGKRKKDARKMAKTKMYLDAVKHLVEGDNIKKLFPEL